MVTDILLEIWASRFLWQPISPTLYLYLGSYVFNKLSIRPTICIEGLEAISF